VSGLLKKTISKRMSGERPSALQSGLSAAVAGAAVAVMTYRLMRSS